MVTVEIEAGMPTGITTIPTPTPLGPIAVGEGAVWVENRDGSVTKVDPATNAVVARIPMPYAIPAGFGGWIATGDGSVWISNDSENDLVHSVTRIDAVTNAVVATIPVGTGPGGIAVTPAGVWVANHRGVSLSRIDPATNHVVATVPLRSEPGDLAFAGGSVWLSELDPDRPGYYDLERLDPSTGTITARTPVPGHILFGTDGGSLWLESIDENKIYPVDLATNQLGQPFTATISPVLGVGLGAVWTASGGLVRYDPLTGKATRRWRFANSGGLAVGYDSVWIGSTGGLLRIQP
jgi:YVTN family beta-propeller protein